jgi:hypothetical protein
LIKSILFDLPPLERRPRKRIQRRQVSYTSSDEWDFNDDDNIDCDNGNSPLNNLPPHSSSDAINSINCSADYVKSYGSSKADQHDYVTPTPREAVDLPTPKRHISFGHVVVRNPPQPSALLSTSQPVYSAIESDDSPITTSSLIGPSIDKRAKKPTSNPSYYPIYGESAVSETCVKWIQDEGSNLFCHLPTRNVIQKGSRTLPNHCVWQDCLWVVMACSQGIISQSLQAAKVQVSVKRKLKGR